MDMNPVSTKVYIVDDDEAVRDSLKMLLESYGMEVEDYASTREFAHAYRPGSRQCLILDQHLPGGTGLDFLASSLGTAPSLPVILVTGRGDGSIRDRAHEMGVQAYLEKPLADDVLLAAISRAIGGHA
jgi:two-component system, LuxR family, response regulator FixJ